MAWHELSTKPLPRPMRGVYHCDNIIKRTRFIGWVFTTDWCVGPLHPSPPSPTLHDDVIKWKHFPRNWPFVRGIHRSPVNSPHKGQWRGALMFSLICARVHAWVNNREAGDLRRRRAHYDIIVMGGSKITDHGESSWFPTIIWKRWRSIAIKPCAHPLSHWWCDQQFSIRTTKWSRDTINSLRPGQDGRRFADDIFTCIFINENCCILIKFSLKYVRKDPIDNNPALVQTMAWRRSEDKTLSEPMMISFTTHICVNRPQWVNAFK